MNWINAILHASIGYGIRRKSWPEGKILHLNENRKRFEWADGTQTPSDLWVATEFLKSVTGEANSTEPAGDWEVI